MEHVLVKKVLLLLFKECSKTCETCTSNITLCNSCYPNSKRELVNNSCLCKDGFFDNLD